MTATAEVIILSSSPEHNPASTPAPPKFDAQKLFGLSPIDTSTPQLPSPSDLFRDQSRSRFFDSGKQPDKRTRKPTKTTCKSTEAAKSDATGVGVKGDQVEDKVKKRGRPKKKDSAEASNDGPTETISTKKPPATERKTKTSGTTIKRDTAANKTISGRVGKASASSQSSKGQIGKKAGPPSTPQVSSKQDSAIDAQDWTKDGLQIEQALKRRLDWTPTELTVGQTSKLDNNLAQDTNETRSFGTMLSEFGFGGVPASRVESQALEDTGPTKRRRIELLNSRICSGNKPSDNDSSDKHSTEGGSSNLKASSVAKKSKKPTKKFSTLTARVTAQYLTDSAQAMDDSEMSTTASISSSLASRKPTIKKGKSNAKAREPELVILSPQAAVRSLHDQELVFGTCSQLEREDSPTLIRELQTAIRESEQSLALETSTRISHSASNDQSLAVSRFTASRNLWSVAARDTDGSVLPVEVVDLVDGSDTPKPRPTINNENTAGKEEETASVTSKTGTIPDTQESGDESSSSNTEISNTLDNQTSVTTSQPSAPRPEMPHFSSFTDAQLCKRIASYGFKPIRSRPKMIEILTKCWESKNGTTHPSVPENPAPQPPTALTLGTTTHKGPTKGTTKPRKTTATKKTNTRSKHKTSSEPSNPERTTSSSSSKPGTTKSKKARTSQNIHQTTKPTHKTATSTSTIPTYSFANVEEIQDSEDDESIPSPSRLQARYLHHHNPTTQPTSLPTTTTTTTILSPSPTRRRRPNPTKNTKASATTSTGIETPNLHDQITQAVHLQPRLRPTSVSRQPSWHEKILMYDPIFLEDFTTWLNTEGLGLVDEDREVGAALVKEWCEGRGVCCCYRKKGREG